MKLDKTKYRYDENIDKEKNREDWGRVRGIMYVLEFAEKEGLLEGCIIEGIIYSKKYTDYLREEGDNRVAVNLKRGSNLTLEARQLLDDYMDYYPDYTEETLEEILEEFEGVIIYG